jgi:hypothetical protein
MNKRARITFEFEVDLDMVPGAYHQVEDWHTYVQQTLCHTATYNPTVKIISTEVKPSVYVEGKGWVAPTFDDIGVEEDSDSELSDRQRRLIVDYPITSNWKLSADACDYYRSQCNELRGARTGLGNSHIDRIYKSLFKHTAWMCNTDEEDLAIYDTMIEKDATGRECRPDPEETRPLPRDDY